jgi:hypothetical protein
METIILKTHQGVRQIPASLAECPECEYPVRRTQAIHQAI